MNAAASATPRPRGLTTSLPELLIAAIAAVLITLEVWLFDPGGWTAGRTVAGLAAALALAFLRQAPFPAFLVNGASVFALVGLGFPSDFYQWTNLVALFVVASRTHLAKGLFSLALGYAGIVFYFLRFPDEGPLAVTGAVLAIYTAGWFAGRTQLARSRAAAARQENELARADLDAQRARAELTAERSRIAQDLHDVVGHAVNVMVVHAGAGQGTPEDDPKSREIFRTIAATGRTALADLDRMLDVLQGNAERTPLPGLADLTALCDAVRATGLGVELSVSDGAEDVPASVGLTTYRIVQEALTNVIKHANARLVSVDVALDHEVLITVRDNGSGDPSVPGRGLKGIDERAALHGGSATHGRDPDGGFTLAVRLDARSGT